jgi:hypothetical protein
MNIQARSPPKSSQASSQSAFAKNREHQTTTNTLCRRDCDQHRQQPGSDISCYIFQSDNTQKLLRRGPDVEKSPPATQPNHEVPRFPLTVAPNKRYRPHLQRQPPEHHPREPLWAQTGRRYKHLHPALQHPPGSFKPAKKPPNPRSLKSWTSPLVCHHTQVERMVPRPIMMLARWCRFSLANGLHSCCAPT